LQERTVRIIAGVKSRNSCRNLFMSLETLPLSCVYIFTLMSIVVNNQEHFQTNAAIHSVNTRNRDHLPRPTATLSCFKKSAYYAVQEYMEKSLLKQFREKLCTL
jgi:IS1 family transposase